MPTIDFNYTSPAQIKKGPIRKPGEPDKEFKERLAAHAEKEEKRINALTAQEEGRHFSALH